MMQYDIHNDTFRGVGLINQYFAYLFNILFHGTYFGICCAVSGGKRYKNLRTKLKCLA